MPPAAAVLPVVVPPVAAQCPVLEVLPAAEADNRAPARVVPEAVADNRAPARGDSPVRVVLEADSRVPVRVDSLAAVFRPCQVIPAERLQELVAEARLVATRVPETPDSMAVQDKAAQAEFPDRAASRVPARVDFPVRVVPEAASRVPARADSPVEHRAPLVVRVAGADFLVKVAERERLDFPVERVERVVVGVDSPEHPDVARRSCPRLNLVRPITWPISLWPSWWPET